MWSKSKGPVERIQNGDPDKENPLDGCQVWHLRADQSWTSEVPKDFAFAVRYFHRLVSNLFRC